MDLNVTEGDPLSLNCTFTNAERIVWRKDGIEITSEDASFRINDLVSAADTSLLSLSPNAEHTVHTGVYDCVAMISGKEFSSNFTITVQCKYDCVCVCVFVCVCVCVCVCKYLLVVGGGQHRHQLEIISAVADLGGFLGPNTKRY